MFWKLVVYLLLLMHIGDVNVLHSSESLSDVPDCPHESTVSLATVSSYEQALSLWKTPEDISGWVAAHFSYDLTRAMQFSETDRTKNEQPLIYTPSEFFNSKTGVCLDLVRFGVETLKMIDPQSRPRYLMIEFSPMQINNHVLRFHWLGTFRRGGKIYFFADSKRPGYIAGPYDEIQDFVREYEQYRGRKVLAYKELDSYQKRQQMKAIKRKALEKP